MSSLFFGASLGEFELIYDGVAYQGDHPDGPPTPLYDDDCGVLATVSADVADAIALEGTGRLLDGRLSNVSGACACPQSPCFLESTTRTRGDGVAMLGEAPWSAFVYDGCVVAGDTGGGIVAERARGDRRRRALRRRARAVIHGS